MPALVSARKTAASECQRLTQGYQQNRLATSPALLNVPPKFSPSAWSRPDCPVALMRTNSYSNHERSHLDAYHHRAMAAETRSLQQECSMSTETRSIQQECSMSTETRSLQQGWLKSTESQSLLKGPTTRWPMSCIDCICCCMRCIIMLL